MKPFTDKSSTNRVEKTRGFLKSLASGHDHRYFFGDGFPKSEEILQDARASLEVFERLLGYDSDSSRLDTLRDKIEEARDRYSKAIMRAFPIGSLIATKYYGQGMTAKVVGYPVNIADGWLQAVSVKGVKTVSVHVSQSSITNQERSES